MAFVVTYKNRRLQICRLTIACQLRFNVWVAHADHSRSRQINLVPDTHLTSSNGGNPVPADGCVEGGVVCSEYAAVKLRRILVFFLYSAEMLVANNFYRKIVLAFAKQTSHIEFSTHESSFYASKLLTVQEHICFPVYTIEVQPLLRPIKTTDLEHITIPEVGAEIRLRYLFCVISIVWIGNGSYIYKRCKHRTRYRGSNPVLAVESLRSDLLATGIYLRGSLQLPVSAT